MLRVPQHERKKINDINSFSFVLSAVEGLLRVFQQPASQRHLKIARARGARRADEIEQAFSMMIRERAEALSTAPEREKGVGILLHRVTVLIIMCERNLGS
jgi:hypothetical protein